jgi:hypothetical protein
VGKKAILKEVPNETITRYEQHSDQTITKLMQIFHSNMNKLSGYFFNVKFDYMTPKKERQKGENQNQTTIGNGSHDTNTR